MECSPLKCLSEGNLHYCTSLLNVPYNCRFNLKLFALLVLFCILFFLVFGIVFSNFLPLFFPPYGLLHKDNPNRPAAILRPGVFFLLTFKCEEVAVVENHRRGVVLRFQSDESSFFIRPISPHRASINHLASHPLCPTKELTLYCLLIPNSIILCSPVQPYNCLPFPQCFFFSPHRLNSSPVSGIRPPLVNIF